MKLKLDKKFVPCEVFDGDEIYPNGIFHFNITKIIEYISHNKDQFTLESIDIKTTRYRWAATLDEDTIKAAQISNPIILAEISPERYNIIDGNHRFERAFREGKTEILGYKLKMHQHLKFLTTIDGYTTYVQYWNEKMKEISKTMKAKN